MGMMKEFKEFAIKGNVVDMAIGIIIGAAFGKIITSLVNDIIMPPISLLFGDIDFANLKIILTQGEGGASINYGMFINVVIDFLIVAFVIFLVIRQMNKLKRKEEPKPVAVTTKECPFCTSEQPK